MAVELREHDRRISGLHRTVGAIGTTVGDHTTKITVVTTELRETREDIAEIKRQIERSDEDRKKEGAYTRRAFYIAASSMFGFMLSIIGLIAVLVSHA